MKWESGNFFPKFFHQADGEAAKSQKAFLRWRKIEFISLGIAAVAALLPRDLLWGAGPLIAVAAFAVPVGIRLSQAEPRAERRWYDARAAAESIKSASWQYAVGGESFRIGDPNARKRFHEMVRDICRELPSWQIGTSGDGSLVTTDMDSLRISGIETRKAVYTEHRVVNQVNWYQGKSRFNRRRALGWGISVLVVEITALAVGLVNLYQPLGIDYLGALAAIAAGLAGWKQTKRFNELSEAYALTSNEAFLVKDSLDTSTEGTWAQSVTSAETAFSREHAMWLARRQGPLP